VISLHRLPPLGVRNRSKRIRFEGRQAGIEKRVQQLASFTPAGAPLSGSRSAVSRLIEWGRNCHGGK